KGAHRRRYRKTTERDPEAAPAPDLMNRDFTATGLDQKYVADITYVRTWEGWLYCCAILDVGSRRVVGWAMADHMRAELVCDALKMAVRARRPRPGLVFHADRGSQYTSADLRGLLGTHKMLQSLAAPGQCWDCDDAGMAIFSMRGSPGPPARTA
ncbi:MAG TPA: DDE-type integrase/transposase/recombinase, partial [Solirubrobacteraceae bacterium]|nr:DDE-type integrase/transposase/recombinase [Solirubrobacteraceae bacterium]